MKSENILLNFEDSLATITLNRPGRKNAITGPLNAELAAAFEVINNKDDVKACLLYTSDAADE